MKIAFFSVRNDEYDFVDEYEKIRCRINQNIRCINSRKCTFMCWSSSSEYHDNKS